MGETTPEVLYHYCSLDTFYNIMKNCSIWLSDIRKSNDSEELQWIIKMVQTHFFEYNPHLLIIPDQISQEEYERKKSISLTIDYILRNDVFKCWGFCLSEKRDNLGQWRGYADNGKGISIGFKTQAFSQIPAIAQSVNRAKSVAFGKVLYGKAAVDALFSQCPTTSAGKLSDTFESMERTFGGALLYAPFCKNDAFEEEKEWRLIISMAEDALQNNMDWKQFPFPQKSNFSILRLGFIPKNNTLVSHIELGIDAMKSVVDSITIGPKSNLSVEDVQLFLISLGLLDNLEDTSIAVIPSEASYR